MVIVKGDLYNVWQKAVGERCRTESEVAFVEEARVTSGGEALELTETKWSISALAKVLWSVLREDQQSIC